MNKKQRSEYFRKLGKKGGKKVHRLYGSEHFKKMAAKSNEKQHGSKKVA